jgi:acylglycerol lipase
MIPKVRSFAALRMTIIVFLAMITACTPLSQPVAIVEHSQAALSKNTFITADGTKLPLRTWLPKGKPKAIILALHGFNDYSRAFESAGKYFSARGVAVYAYDQRGFGASPMTGIWAGEENLIADVKQSVALLKKRYPHTPLYLLGESMGGAVGIVANVPSVNGLILVAPAVWKPNPLLQATLWMMAHTVPGKKLTGEDLKILASDNIEMLNAMWLDTLVIKATRVDAIYGLVELMGDAYEQAGEVQTPTLLLHGDHDEVISREPVKAVAQRYSAPLKIIYYPSGYHMLLRDLEGKKVTHDILKWMAETNRL